MYKYDMNNISRSYKSDIFVGTFSILLLDISLYIYNIYNNLYNNIYIYRHDDNMTY